MDFPFSQTMLKQLIDVGEVEPGSIAHQQAQHLLKTHSAYVTKVDTELYDIVYRNPTLFSGRGMVVHVPR
jgi:hypothetical protein